MTKDGVAQELTRINHYLEGAGMPLLEAVTNGNGGCTVQEMEAKTLSPEFQAYVDKRRAARAGTFAYKFRLAKMRCGQISNADIKGFETQMINDGLSESSIQKEIALLKVFYNNVGTLNWKGLENPCLGIKLGKSQRRFVHLTPAQKMALTQSLQECDNPYFMPLALTAKESTLRLDTLVNMTWSNTSVEERTAYLPTKTGTRPYTLSKEVQTILAGLPQAPDGKIFPMSKSAINSTWDRVRLQCGLPKLQFRDLRHLGATDWVRRGLSAHQLKQVLGHDSIATAQFYVDLVGKDLEDALDKASGNAGVMVMPAVFPKDPHAHLNQRRAERLNKSKVQSPQESPTPESTSLPRQEISGELLQDIIEPGPMVAAKPSGKVVSLDAFRRKVA
ncbi:MAG: tyrosine-type recombinase/integrase [Rhodoferax sp.]|uniref:tyrosine-type recombinase/integrase n=1 Tax=Rhodoferax sp. TaxID=50421 RepID=UPI00271CED7E|nr:tyrosine-type recombinase/integrase [Rhodoferax sp.]MDO8451109.1 tyrosine-type recombinase/integrase [Rhodoferax sp.]